MSAAWWGAAIVLGVWAVFALAFCVLALATHKRRPRRDLLRDQLMAHQYNWDTPPYPVEVSDRWKKPSPSTRAEYRDNMRSDR